MEYYWLHDAFNELIHSNVCFVRFYWKFNSAIEIRFHRFFFLSLSLSPESMFYLHTDRISIRIHVCILLLTGSDHKSFISLSYSYLISNVWGRTTEATDSLKYFFVFFLSLISLEYHVDCRMYEIKFRFARVIYMRKEHLTLLQFNMHVCLLFFLFLFLFLFVVVNHIFNINFDGIR